MVGSRLKSYGEECQCFGLQRSVHLFICLQMMYHGPSYPDLWVAPGPLLVSQMGRGSPQKRRIIFQGCGIFLRTVNLCHRDWLTKKLSSQ